MSPCRCAPAPFCCRKQASWRGRPRPPNTIRTKRFANDFPDVHIKQGARFVEAGNLASAGGLSSGIDLALRVVEREVAKNTAYQMEYRSQGWLRLRRSKESRRPSIPSVQCARWKSSRTRLRARSIKARATTSARPRTRSSSTQRRRSGCELPTTQLREMVTFKTLHGLATVTFRGSVYREID